MAKVANIRVFGDPVLRQQAKYLPLVQVETQGIVDLMKATMLAYKGIGLAAPQIGLSTRIIIVDIPSGYVPRDQITPMINPVIVSASKEMQVSDEGCLSIPSVFAEVPRPRYLLVDYLTVANEHRRVSVTGLSAACVQHEIDHLDGKLFIDYLSPLKRRAVLARWDAIKGAYPDFIRTRIV